MRISDWSSDVCSSDLGLDELLRHFAQARHVHGEPPARRQRDRGIAFLAREFVSDADFAAGNADSNLWHVFLPFFIATMVPCLPPLRKSLDWKAPDTAPTIDAAKGPR